MVEQAREQRFIAGRKWFQCYQGREYIISWLNISTEWQKGKGKDDFRLVWQMLTLTTSRTLLLDMPLMASSSRCKLMLTIFPCGRQVYFFILPRRKQSFNDIIKVLVQTWDKHRSYLETWVSHFFSFTFHTSSWPLSSFCGSSGVNVLLSSEREGSSADKLQLALWTAPVAVPAEEEKFTNEM